jgi:putative endonuclease
MKGAKADDRRRPFFVFYIYIIYSPSPDKYYLGYSNDPIRRLDEHNSTPHNTYTCKHRPWFLKAHFKCSEQEAEAIRIERLSNPTFLPSDALAQLVRVPDVRD